jgi:Ca-activated chloride channel family protein
VFVPEFSHPLVLLLLPAVPLLVWAWLRLSRGALRYPSTSILVELPRGRTKWARRGGAALRGTALAALVVALAGPRWPDPGTRLPTEGIAINILLDVSGSMAERDFTWTEPATGKTQDISRLEAVKKVFHLFVAGGEVGGGQRLPGRETDLIGLVTFATRPESACPLTLSHSVLLDKILNEEQARSDPEEARTNIGDAIAWGLHRLQSAGGRRKVLILLTDGEHNVPPPALKPRQAAQLAGNLGVPIYVLDAGSDRPSPDGGVENTSAVDRLNAKATLQQVAKITGGQYFTAEDTRGLIEACTRIDEMERQRIESFQYRRYYEGFAWFGLAAFVLIVAVLGLEATFWRKVP